VQTYGWSAQEGTLCSVGSRCGCTYGVRILGDQLQAQSSNGHPRIAVTASLPAGFCRNRGALTRLNCNDRPRTTVGER